MPFTGHTRNGWLLRLARLATSAAAEAPCDQPAHTCDMHGNRLWRDELGASPRYARTVAGTLARAGHWAIENKLHWVCDVTYGEDVAVICGSTPQMMAALRNLALSLFRLAGETNIAAAGRHNAAQPAFAFAAIER